jgi:hypothetical protein
MTQPRLSRRTIVKAGLLGTGLLAFSGLGIGLQTTVSRVPQGTLRALSAREFSILAAIADRVCMTEPGMPSASELQVAEQVDGTVFRMHRGAAKEFKQLLALFENALFGLVLDGTGRPFTACSTATQDRILEAWRLSRIPVRRTGFRAISGLCMAAYWSQPQTWTVLGYPGPPVFNLDPAPQIIQPSKPIVTP